MAKVTPIYAVRHGPVDAPGRCYGQLDLPSALPASKAHDMVRVQLVEHPAPWHCWTSPLSRCRDVAATFSDELKVEPRLMEMSFGQWEGLRWDDIHEQAPEAMERWGADWLNVPAPGGENALQVQRRVNDWLREAATGEPLLVFTHAGVIRSLRVICKGLTWQEAMAQPVAHLCPETFVFEP